MPSCSFNRSVIAYWILGLCNNYGYVVMLSAAHDILARENGSSGYEETEEYTNADRHCNPMSTGIILLADIIPSLFVKLTVPFLPLWMNIRVFITVAFSAIGFVLVGMANSFESTILGVVCTAFASRLGESTLLSFTVFYKDKSIISAWSSGTGGAGFFGSMTYAALLAIGLSPSTTLYLLLIVPTMMAISFWIMLENPLSFETTETSEIKSSEVRSSSSEMPIGISTENFQSRIKKVSVSLKYILPLGLVYYFEYLINQGLMELSLVENTFIDGSTQYRWYQVCYQIGVFVSRSSISVIQINNLWLLAILQGVNLVYFILEAIYQLTNNVFIIIAVILWEGLLGGLTYVNSFYKIQVEENPSDREVITGITTISDTVGVTLAGFSAIPVHNIICSMPKLRLPI